MYPPVPKTLLTESCYTCLHVSHQSNSKKISDLNLTLIRGIQRDNRETAVWKMAVSSLNAYGRSLSWPISDIVIDQVQEPDLRTSHDS